MQCLDHECVVATLHNDAGGGFSTVDERHHALSSVEVVQELCPDSHNIVTGQNVVLVQRRGQSVGSQVLADALVTHHNHVVEWQAAGLADCACAMLLSEEQCLDTVNKLLQLGLVDCLLQVSQSGRGAHASM